MKPDERYESQACVTNLKRLRMDGGVRRYLVPVAFFYYYNTTEVLKPPMTNKRRFKGPATEISLAGDTVRSGDQKWKERLQI